MPRSRGRRLTAHRKGNPSAPLRVVVIGQTHGNERADVVTAEHLRTSTAVSTRADVWVIPTMNPDGHARGSVYSSPATGAHEVYGAIRDRWASLRWEAGPLGLPTRGEHDVPGGRRGTFEGGSITWDRATGATTVLYGERP